MQRSTKRRHVRGAEHQFRGQRPGAGVGSGTPSPCLHNHFEVAGARPPHASQGRGTTGRGGTAGAGASSAAIEASSRAWTVRRNQIDAQAARCPEGRGSDRVHMHFGMPALNRARRDHEAARVVWRNPTTRLCGGAVGKRQSCRARPSATCGRRRHHAGDLRRRCRCRRSSADTLRIARHRLRDVSGLPRDRRRSAGAPPERVATALGAHQADGWTGARRRWRCAAHPRHLGRSHGNAARGHEVDAHRSREAGGTSADLGREKGRCQSEPRSVGARRAVTRPGLADLGRGDVNSRQRSLPHGQPYFADRWCRYPLFATGIAPFSQNHHLVGSDDGVLDRGGGEESRAEDGPKLHEK